MSVRAEVLLGNIKIANVFHHPVQAENMNFNPYIYILYYHIFRALFVAITQSAYTISSFPPTGYQPAVMITGIHVF